MFNSVQVRGRRGMWLSCAFAGLGLAAPALADVDWSLHAGLAHTDNAALTYSHREADTLASVGSTLGVDYRSSRLEVGLQGNGSYQSYLDDTFADDFVGQAVGRAVLGLVEERLFWTLEDTYGQVAVNQFDPVTPENRQNVNTLSTGPDLLLRLAGQTTLRIAGRYGDVRFEDSGDIDQRNWGGSASLERRVSPQTGFGLTASQQRYEYDAPSSPHYDQQALYLGGTIGGARQSLSLEAGVNRVKVENNRYSRPLLRLGWQRQITPSWTLDANLGSEFQNSSEQFAAKADGTTGDPESVGLSAAPAGSHRGDLTATFERSRTRFSFGGGVSKLDYPGDLGVDEKGWSAAASISRRIRPRLEGYLKASITRRNYEQGFNAGYRERIAEVGVDWRLGRSTSLILGYQLRDADSLDLDYRYKQNLLSGKIAYRRSD